MYMGHRELSVISLPHFHLKVLLHGQDVGCHVLQGLLAGQGCEEGGAEGVVRTAHPVGHHQHPHHTLQGKVGRHQLNHVFQENGDSTVLCGCRRGVGLWGRGCGVGLVC